MEFAALTAWVLAAMTGGYLLVIWLARGGPKVTRYPSLILAGHPLAAVAGLAVWIGYLATARAAYAWVALAALAVVTFQGFMLFTRWLVGEGGRHARGGEQHFPATATGVAVAVHGCVAVTTVVLVAMCVTRA